MKGLYYHPKRIKHNGAPILIDSGKHDAITLFVKLIEEMTPQVLEDLKEEVYDAYAAANQWHANQKKLTQSHSPSEWKLVKASNSDHFPAYIYLKEKLIKWSNKYHLNGEDDLYLALGLWSISDYYDDCKECSRKEREEEIKEDARLFGVPVDACRSWPIYKYSWPYEESLSLSECLYFEVELDDIELSKSIGNGKQRHSFFFSRMFPFTFTPDKLIDYEKHENNASAFETLRLYDERKRVFIEETKTSDLSKYSVLTRPWEEGIGWDPRKEIWREFEERIDKIYAQYKTFYRERSLRFLEERGYVKDKEKRNLEHFKWLVDYQIKGWSLSQIADHYSALKNEIIKKDTIFHGLKNTANLVLVSLRSSKNK